MQVATRKAIYKTSCLAGEHTVCDRLCITNHSLQDVNFQYESKLQHTGRNSSILPLCHGWHLPSTMHLLAKFGSQTLYAFVENEAISSWVISKQSTNAELEMDISRNVHFNCINLPSYNSRTISPMDKGNNSSTIRRMDKSRTLSLSTKVW